MIIRAGDDSVEIEVLECTPPSQPRSGDTRLRVVVSSEGFSGSGTVWIGSEELAQFVRQLTELELRREGSATLESMSPGELVLCIHAIDSWGHMAVKGQLAQQKHFGGARGPYPHRVEFGFDIDPMVLPPVLSEFQAIAQFTA
jgi:hypothetical protein